MKPILRQVETNFKYLRGEGGGGTTVRIPADEYARMEAEAKAKHKADIDRRRALGEKVDWEFALQAAVVVMGVPHRPHPRFKADRFLISRYVRYPVDLWIPGSWGIEREVEAENLIGRKFKKWERLFHGGNFLCWQDALQFLVQADDAYGEKEHIILNAAVSDFYRAGRLVPYKEGALR